MTRHGGAPALPRSLEPVERAEGTAAAGAQPRAAQRGVWAGEARRGEERSRARQRSAAGRADGLTDGARRCSGLGRGSRGRTGRGWSSGPATSAVSEVRAQGAASEAGIRL